MKESDLQRTIIDAAHLFGWMCYHAYDSRRSQPGFPDLVLLHKASGQTCLVVRPSDLDDLIARLRTR